MDSVESEKDIVVLLAGQRLGGVKRTACRITNLKLVNEHRYWVQLRGLIFISHDVRWL